MLTVYLLEIDFGSDGKRTGACVDAFVPAMLLPDATQKSQVAATNSAKACFLRLRKLFITTKTSRVER
jgi:hypothetical protein